MSASSVRAARSGVGQLRADVAAPAGQENPDGDCVPTPVAEVRTHFERRFEAGLRASVDDEPGRDRQLRPAYRQFADPKEETGDFGDWADGIAPLGADPESWVEDVTLSDDGPELEEGVVQTCVRLSNGEVYRYGMFRSGPGAWLITGTVKAGRECPGNVRARMTVAIRAREHHRHPRRGPGETELRRSASPRSA